MLKTASSEIKDAFKQEIAKNVQESGDSHVNDDDDDNLILDEYHSDDAGDDKDSDDDENDDNDVHCIKVSTILRHIHKFLLKLKV